MASRASLNKVMLIGNLTRDPELRYTPSGAAVCTFGMATNRTYTSSDGAKKEETEFHKIVTWNKLAELCSQLLRKGRKVYVEGRLSTRSWETPDGQTRTTTEVVVDDMRILDSRREAGLEPYEAPASAAVVQEAPKVPAGVDEGKDKAPEPISQGKTSQVKEKSGEEEEQDKKKKSEGPEEVDLDDLPF